jgi:hypothetical protein
MAEFPYSFRNFEIGVFSEAYKRCKTVECQRRIRQTYREFEGGRWWKAMNSLHSFLTALDADELEKFAKLFPNLIEAVDEFATIEEVSKVWEWSK